jgi:hypothetical protein
LGRVAHPLTGFEFSGGRLLAIFRGVGRFDLFSTCPQHDLRVMKANDSSCTGSPTVDILYWRNIAGQTIAETDGSGSTSNSAYNEYVFFAGRRIAQSNPSSGNVYYYFVDHLGSTRVVTTASGSPWRCSP